MPQPAPVQSYDRAKNVVHISHPNAIRLSAPEDIRAYFDAVVTFWRLNCEGRRAYYLVAWDGFEVMARETDFYATQVKRVVDECAITIVRYTSNSLQRTMGRLVATKLHAPSHVYETREQALGIVEGLRAGEIRIGR